MARRLLPPVGVQTLCQQPRAAGGLVFSHGCQPRPDAVRGACAARGPWRKRVNRVSRRARPGAGGASTLPTGWSDRGGQRAPRSGPMTSLQAQRSRRRRPHHSCTLSSNACGHTRLRQDATRARPARTTIPLSQPTALAVAHGETMVLHAVVDSGRLRPRLACPPPEVPTRGQGAHILAARSWHHASCCGLPPSPICCSAKGCKRQRSGRMLWHSACFALQAWVPRGAAAPCRAAVRTAHAHRPRGEREAHGMMREQR